MSAAGLVTTRQTRGFTLDRPKEQWLKLVANRFMSLLSTFSDEITQGLSEIEQNLADIDSVRFCDNFEFVLGRKPAP
jgi:hypothetical protein